MSGVQIVPLPTLSVTKDLVAAAGPPNAIRPLVAIGYSSQGDVAVPSAYTNPGTLQTDLGHGSLVEALAFALSPYGAVQTVHAVRAGGANVGVYGSITSDFADADAPMIAADTVVLPGDTLEPKVRFTTGGELGVDGITYQYSTDGGYSYFDEVELGLAYTISLPFGAGKYILNPPVGALVDFAAEVRANLLAHFADASVHNSADAIAAALITASVPTTNAEAVTVLNQCRSAVASHLLNATAHDSADVAHTITAPAATDQQSAITLGIDIKAKANAHFGIAVAADTDGLLAATATTVGVQSYTDEDLDAAGIASLDAYPRALTFTTAGGTPSDAPATVSITGFDVNGAGQTESALAISQSAATVTSTKKWRGTGLTITYAAGDGADATVAIGLPAAVHNSADGDNVITRDDPVRGVITAEDEFYLLTTGPSPSSAQIVAAVRSLRDYGRDFGSILFTEPVTGGLLQTIAAEVDDLRRYAKFRDFIVSFRLPNVGETYLQYKAAAKLSFAGYSATDGRVVGSANRAYSVLQQTATGFAAPLRPPAWWMAAARARSEPEINLQSLSAAQGVLIKDSRGNTLARCFDEHSTQWSVECRMIGIRSNPQKSSSGVYVTQDLCLFGENSPWVLGPYTTVANHLVETIQAYLVSTLGRGFQSPPGVPFEEDIRKLLEDGANTLAVAEGVDKGRCTEAVVQLDPAAGLNGFVPWSLTIVPLNYNINGASLKVGLSAIRINAVTAIN